MDLKNKVIKRYEEESLTINEDIIKQFRRSK